MGIENDQEESLITSVKNKISKSVNVHLEKAKIVLFSDLGFDVVLKIKNLKLINDKNSYKEENDKEYEKCNTVRIFIIKIQYLNIGKIQLVYYENSLKKTGKFQIFEYENIKLFNFNQTAQSMKKLLKFSDILQFKVT